MNSRIIIITAGLGIPSSTCSSTILFDICVFLFYITLTDIYLMSVFSCMYIYVLLCVLNKDQSIIMVLNIIRVCMIYF